MMADINVKEFINELLNYPMDMTVKFYVNPYELNMDECPRCEKPIGIDIDETACEFDMTIERKSFNELSVYLDKE